MNQVKERVSVSRINLTAGKFSLGDFFDNNNVSHDPRSDFMNWALMNNGAYDYAANTRGYTYGFEAELVKPAWTLRFATALEPTYSNGPDLDWHYSKTNSENLEFEKRYALHGHKGAWRLLGFYNVNKAPNYDDAVAAKQNGTDTTLDAVYGKKYGSKKIGLGLNMEQEFSSRVNAFVRLGWNYDGKTRHLGIRGDRQRTVRRHPHQRRRLASQRPIISVSRFFPMGCPRAIVISWPLEAMGS